MDHVIIVDDDAAVRAALAALLRSLSYQVLCFESGESFLAVQGRLPRAVVLLDVDLPGRNGFEVLLRLAAGRLDWPVIVVTGRVDPGLWTRAQRAGALALLEKPLEEALLLSYLTAAFESMGDIP